MCPFPLVGQLTRQTLVSPSGGEQTSGVRAPNLVPPMVRRRPTSHCVLDGQRGEGLSGRLTLRHLPGPPLTIRVSPKGRLS